MAQQGEIHQMTKGDTTHLPLGFHLAWAAILLSCLLGFGLLLHDADRDHDQRVLHYEARAQSAADLLASDLNARIGAAGDVVRLAGEKRLRWSDILAPGPTGMRPAPEHGSMPLGIIHLGETGAALVQYGQNATDDVLAAWRRLCKAETEEEQPPGRPTPRLLPLAFLPVGEMLRSFLPIAFQMQPAGGCPSTIALLDGQLPDILLSRANVDFGAVTTQDGRVLATFPARLPPANLRLERDLRLVRDTATPFPKPIMASIDGEARILAIAASAELPFGVVTGFNASRVATETASRHRMLALAFCLVVLTLTLSYFLFRRAALARLSFVDGIIQDAEESRERMQLVLETAEQGIWEWMPKSGDMYLSDRWRDSLGFGPAGEAVLFQAWLNRVHPDDRSQVMEALHDCIRGRNAEFRQRYRVRSATRGWRWVQCFGQALERDAKGEALRITGTVRDITTEVDASIQAGLAEIIFADVSDGIAILDAQSRYLRVNRAFTDITGYSQEELIGRHPSMLYADLNNRVTAQEIWASLQVRGTWRGEIWNRHKSGTLYAVWRSITALRDESGRITRYAALYSDITDQKRKEEMLERQAYFDSLTDLPNRRLFFEKLEQEIEASSRTGQMFFLLFIDIDNFKVINESHGHIFGDRVLIEVAKRLVACCHPGDTVARIGGDEFVILAKPGGLPQAEVLSGKVLSALYDPLLTKDGTRLLKVSIGTSCFPLHGTSVQSLMEGPAIPLSDVKDGPARRRDTAAQERASLTTALQLALRDQSLSMEFQAIHDLTSRRPVKAEALVRWVMDDRQVPPAQFIPLAEDSDLICDIGDFAFETVLALLLRIQSQGVLAEGFSFALNQSPRQLEQRDTPAIWLRRLQGEDIAPSRFSLDLSPRFFAREYPIANQRLRTFVAAGIGLAMDDFGTGPSTPDALTRLPIREIKIERALIARLPSDPETRRIVHSMIGLAKSAGITSVAEGVETEGQMDILAEMGCDMAQGFLLSMPMTEEEFLAEMMRQRAVTPRREMN